MAPCRQRNALLRTLPAGLLSPTAACSGHFCRQQAFKGIETGKSLGSGSG